MRACRFSSATSSSVPRERAPRARTGTASNTSSMRTLVDPDAEPPRAPRARPRCSRRTSTATASRACGPPAGPSASAASVATSAESMPPDSPSDDLAEPVLAHVVAEAEHERPVDLLRPLGHGGRVARARRLRRAGTPARYVRRAGDVDVDHQEVLVEHRRAPGDARRRARRPSSRRRRPARPGRRRRSRRRSTRRSRRARARQTSRRSATLPWWYGEPLMFRMTAAVVARVARRTARRACHASSQTDSPSADEATRTGQAASPGTK